MSEQSQETTGTVVSVEVAARLEYLRGEIHAERISYGEIAELQDLAQYIEPGDVELLQWAGVPEFPDDCPICGANLGPTSEFPWHNPDEDCRAIRGPVPA